MSVITTKNKMLYCPHCQQTYEEGTQRFCTNDGLRLLPASPSGKAANQSSGVFTNIFNRTASADDSKSAEKFSPPPSAARSESDKSFQTSFRPPVNSRIFKSESDVQPEIKSPPVKTFKSEPVFELELDDIPNNRTPVQTPETVITPPETIATPPIIKTVEPEISAPPAEKPAPRNIKEREVPMSQATLGNRKTNPMGRAALTGENPEVLIGQTVKGRYRIVEKIGENESGFVYLAEDKIVEGKRVSVRILMDEEASAFFTDNVFAEERVSLSHVNHPHVASVIDSGELPEGKPFIITEYVEGKSVKEMLASSGQFNALRAARIVRQASYALSEMHQSGIVHRGLTPENIVLTVSENGSEQVKITDFGVSRGTRVRENLEYKAPEQIEGKNVTFAADLYSLAVIAYQMLTNRLPFNASTTNALLKAQRGGLTLRPTDLRFDVSPTVDEILEKSLAFNPAARYPKARDFGDAFFNAATTAESLQTDADENAEKTEADSNRENLKTDTVSAIAGLRSDTAVADDNLTADVSSTETAEQTGADKKSAEDLLWERRSPEPPKTARMNWAITLLLGAIVVGALGILYYAANRQSQPEFVQPTPTIAATPDQTPDIASLQKPTPTPEEIESPPLARMIAPPADSVFFENSKQSLKPESAKNFLGFSLYYPKDWRRNDAKGSFLDVSKNASSGTPVEQMLVGYYDSKGTFKADRDMFPKLVKEKTESQLKPFVPNYRTVSEGETTVNGGWRAYEIKFEGAGKTANGENIKLFGRRLYIPAARNGMKNGYVLTMLATSLSKEVKSAGDVGVKGDLATVLNTFEPNQNF